MTKRIPTFRSLGLVTPARSRRRAYRRSQTATPGLTTSDVGLSLGLAYARVMHTAPGLANVVSSTLVLLPGTVCLLIYMTLQTQIHSRSGLKLFCLIVHTDLLLLLYGAPGRFV